MKFPFPILTLLVGVLSIATIGLEAQDDSVEGLYQTAVEQNSAGQPVEASQTFEKLFDLTGGNDLLFEDYGAQAGGFFFDYGMTLLPQSRWEEAKEAFTICATSDEIAEEVDSPVTSTNARKSLAKFQLGFCEAQMGNHGEALRLYDEYLASSPPADELAQVQNSFKLRYGSSLMKVGRVAEGVATIQELFDNREEWNVSPPFLMQGLLELGLAWVEQANGAAGDGVALEKISEQAHDFLDRNGATLQIEPLDQYRFGFVDRLRTLGFETTKAGLYSLAIRYFAFLPTLDDVKADLNLSLARQPIGTGIPSQFQQIIDSIAAREQAEMHPDAENLRLGANCYGRMGNNHAPRAIYWYLAENFPDVPEEVRAEILHEASRFSFAIGDYSAAQYFGEKFMAEVPEGNPLRNNVSTFMLQALFTAREYDQVIEVSTRVREKYEPGDVERELADSLYPLALYTLKRHEEAAGPLDEYVKAYPDGGNRELVLFHRASNSLVLNKMREAAEQYEDFIKEFPESKQFIDNVYADLAVARFNLEDYSAAITAADNLIAVKPDSLTLPRTLNIKGDAYLVQSGNLGSDQDEKETEWRGEAVDAYLAAIEKGKAAQAKDSERADYHKGVVAEAIWKSADMFYDDGEIEKGLAQYDAFFPDYAGTVWEPQISIFSLEHLEAADRGEEALAQVEKMILQLGSQPPETQDITLLRQAIGSWTEASVRISGLDATIAKLDNFPGMDPANKALLTWLKIQKVIVLQDSRKKMEKDSPEYAAVESQIGDVFEELRLFEKRELSEFALQQIGLYFAGTDNPFLGVPYFEELLARTNPEADAFKGPAEMELGAIEMRAADPAKVSSARERFRRIIDKYQDAALMPQAYLNLAKLHIGNKEWKDALAALDVINKKKTYFKKEREKRAEAGFLMGNVLDELGEPSEANQAYLSVVSTYGAFPDWVTQAWEKYIPNSIEDFEKMPTSTEEEQAAKRDRQLALYKLTKKFLFQWQNWTDDMSPSGALRRLRRDIVEMKTNLGITPEEEAAVNFELGIGGEN